MKKLALALLALFAMALPEGALAQNAVALPTYINPGTTTDIGNGPQDLRITQGNALLSTSQGSGVANSTSSSAVVLTAVPTTAPCVGCLFTASTNPSLTTVTIPAGTFVSAFNGVTSVTLSTNVTLGAGALVGWGAACPATPGVVLPVQASVGGDLPFYTSARICGYSPNGPGAALLAFPIGAH